MPYRVLTSIEVQTEGHKTPGQTPQPGQMFEAGLNILEGEGWTLDNIIQGERPAFIFHQAQSVDIPDPPDTTLHAS